MNSFMQRGAKVRNQELLCLLCGLGDFTPLREIFIAFQGMKLLDHSPALSLGLIFTHIFGWTGGRMGSPAFAAASKRALRSVYQGAASSRAAEGLLASGALSP
jgi:hypothetical protein